MCAAALRWARISRVDLSAADPKAGYSQFGARLFHPKTEIQHGVMEHECGVLMTEFLRENVNDAIETIDAVRKCYTDLSPILAFSSIRL
jgi:hypothetical protein